MTDAPAAPDLDIVRIDQLRLPFFIGVHEFEKFRPQNVEISVKMHVPRSVRQAGEYVSYAVVADYVIARSQANEHIVLVETLAQDVLAKALSDPRVVRAEVTVSKCDIYPQAAGVGITIAGVQPA